MPRKGFHAGAVPFHVAGIGGPGAPHEFTFNRRSDEDLQARASRGCDFEDCMATWLDQKHHHHYQHDYQNSPLQEN